MQGTREESFCCLFTDQSVPNLGTLPHRRRPHHDLDGTLPCVRNSGVLKPASVRGHVAITVTGPFAAPVPRRGTDLAEVNKPAHHPLWYVAGSGNQDKLSVYVTHHRSRLPETNIRQGPACNHSGARSYPFIVRVAQSLTSGLMVTSHHSNLFVAAFLRMQGPLNGSRPVDLMV